MVCVAGTPAHSIIHTHALQQIHAVLLVSRQGKVRLSKQYSAMPAKDMAQLVRQVTTAVIGRPPRLCNVLEWRDVKLVFRRFASLYFVLCVDRAENELIMLELIQHYVEALDGFFGNVCELDIVFQFQKAYYVLDELLIAGELEESSKRTVLRLMEQQETLADAPREDTILPHSLPHPRS